MKCRQCGCSAATCGCCEGIGQLTPASRANRPGLPALRYRVGTHGRFLSSMKARLPTMTVEAPGADGQTIETFRPLEGLTTRDAGDPAIALLDGWATVADVLGFYQERIANEGYLRTAGERRSVLELARLVGYSARPGVAATVHLAYTLEDRQLDPVEIPVGSRAQSIPGPDERPQSFETIEPLQARTEWNNLQVRRSRPQRITLGTVLALEALYVAGSELQLQPGELLLFVFGERADQRALRVVEKADNEFADKRTAIRLRPVMPGVAAALPLLRQAIDGLTALLPASPPGTPPPSSGTQRARDRGQRIFEDALAGQYLPPLFWAVSMRHDADVPLPPEAEAVLAALQEGIVALPGTAAPATVFGHPDRFADDLQKDANPQVANAARLSRDYARSFEDGADVSPQLLVNFAPKLKGSYYSAWRGAALETAASELQGVYTLRSSGPLFGASSTRQPDYDDGQLRPQSEWIEWQYAADETPDNVFLDKAYPAIAPGSYVMLQTAEPGGGLRRRVLQVQRTSTGQRSAYGLNGPTTALEFGADADWRVVGSDNGRHNIDELRRTQFHAESQPLTPVEMPLPAEVSGQQIELGALYDGLRSGRWVIFQGERADVPGVAGVRVAELLMLSGARQEYDATLPGDRIHTTLVLATPTAYRYRRDTLVIYGNVAKGTHGETRSETLGGGDGSQALQAFALRQPPLTYVPAPIPAGAESTLHVYVNEAEWKEADSLTGLGPSARRFVARTDDAGVTTLTFGTGEQGARLPTGLENVKAQYRSGIGREGNVRAEQVSLLVSRPLGAKAVINPLPASGGADRESRELIRENAPLSIQALDRLVSVPDYADFARGFAGIAKAAAQRLSDGDRERVHVTIAGADDIAIEPTSELYRNLVAALRRYGDPGLVVEVASRELIALLLSARIRLQEDYRWEPVVAAVRESLLQRFGFSARALAQPVLLCEVIAVIQAVRGVAYVDVDVFGGVPEKRGDPVSGRRRLLTQREVSRIARQLGRLDDPSEQRAKPVTGAAAEVPRQRVDARPAGLERGVLRPAQLAIFTPAVPDTLILNQIP